VKLERLRLEFSAPELAGWEAAEPMKASKVSDAQKAFILKQGADCQSARNSDPGSASNRDPTLLS
jgi:hypothetical protein